MHGDHGFAWCRTGADAAGKHGIAATMSGNRFACVEQLAGGTDSLDQEEITIPWDGENLHFPKVLQGIFKLLLRRSLKTVFLQGIPRVFKVFHHFPQGTGLRFVQRYRGTPDVCILSI